MNISAKSNFVKSSVAFLFYFSVTSIAQYFHIFMRILCVDFVYVYYMSNINMDVTNHA